MTAGDEVLITHMEHHANIVPWQLLCEEKGASLRVAPIDDRGQLILEEFEKLLSPRTKIVGRNPRLQRPRHRQPGRGDRAPGPRARAPVLVDGAQAVPHGPVDVRKTLDCDFYAFSGHKLFGPSGIGVLYGKAALLEAMPPYMGGGEMILSVSFEKTILQGAAPPLRGGHARHRGRRGSRRGHRLPGGAGSRRPSPPTSTSCSPTGRGALSGSRACDSSEPRSARRP